MVASVSDESASLARRHSSRRRASAASVAGSFGVELDAGRPDQGHRAGEDRLVEVDAAEPLHALGSAELLEAGLGLAQDRRVERAAAEVVDRDDRAGRDALLARVVDRRRLRLGQQRHRTDVRLADRLPEQVDLVLAVARRVAQRDRGRRPAELLADAQHDAAQQVREEGLGAVGRAAEDDRGRVAQAALELAAGPGRLGERPMLGGLAGQDLAVGPQDHDRGDGRRLLAELEDLETIVARRRGSGVRGPEIDPERVLHHLTSTAVRGCTTRLPGAESTVRHVARDVGRYTPGPEGGPRQRCREAEPPRPKPPRRRPSRPAPTRVRRRTPVRSGSRSSWPTSVDPRPSPGATTWPHGSTGSPRGSPGPRPSSASSASSRRARAR